MPAKSPVIVDLKFQPRTGREGLKHAFPGREVINRPIRPSATAISARPHYAVLWKPLDDLFARPKA